ncbi:6-phosphofructokinase [Faecalicatena contorta]|uniref:Pyrophosphate--fructose 6-phosphate 1-phosphotransferase n=1 Tax=Faecalicatena fissicatena TaxID=290055 RepID=A0ABS2EB43_9FIRM|nr:MULTISPECIES: 6-phosphofructokinase [Clostridia]MBM6685778.1 6-phosphofructokinase [Faecalicatena contorta]MBM6710392.1 6-phosphofructokinase [Faecalicatena contorta]MBM6738877.1 6-phosphofructokinase [Faecalicatena fissicatena]HIX99540.1 6-phosphofructokinase [Candidatus Dorea intestinigallinarum]
MKRNVIVGQSGGPTAAINSSLAGVYRTAKDRGANKVYGMLHGIQGLLQERYLDLSEYITTELDAELLKRTPAAFLGSCRFKLPEIHEDRGVYEKIFGILDKLDIEAFIYIGGNDSMDTIKKLSDYAIVTGHPTRFIGCPKTIDNDLALTDHTPGYGSAAKYIGTSVKEIIRDSFCLEYSKGLVSIVEIMGRNAGWLTGAAALAKGEDCEGPDLIYLPELPFDLHAFSDKVKELLSKKPSVVVAVSEGIRTADGTYVCELGSSIDFVDAFGHKQLSGTASYLASFIAGEIGCKTRAIELSSLQRSASHAASRVDILEAYQVGGAAVKAADEGDSGKMVVLQRLSDDPYQCGTEVKDVHKIANDEKLVPREWVNEEGTGVTDEFVAYVRPLIQGDVSPVMVDGIPRHLFRPYNL